MNKWLYLAYFVVFFGINGKAQPVPAALDIKYKTCTVIKKQDSVCVIWNGSRLVITEMPSRGLKFVLQSANGHHQNFQEKNLELQDSPDTAYVADINGDSISDIKVHWKFRGASPLASLVNRKVYLLSNRQGQYAKISFFDFSREPEQDFNKDGLFEIVTKELIRYKKHSYWKIEVYSYVNGQFKNVSLTYGFPKLIPYLIKPAPETYKILSLDERKKLVSVVPREFLIELN